MAPPNDGIHHASGGDRYGKGTRLGISWEQPSGNPKANPPSHALLTAQILEGVLNFKGSSTPSQRPLTDALRQNPGMGLRQALESLDSPQAQDIRSRWGTPLFSDFLSLAGEPDENSFYQGLLRLGTQLQVQGKLDAAALLYDTVTENIPPGLQDLHHQAFHRLEILQGRGSFGEQVELQTGQFVDQAIEPLSLASMIGAQATFGLSRLALLKYLPRNFLGGAFGRIASANVSAFGLEGMAFVGTRRGLSHALRHFNPNEVSLAQELGHTYLTLGLLKTAGKFSTILLNRRLAGLAPQSWGALDHFSQVALPQASMLGGIYLSNALAPKLGLGKEMSPEQNLFQSLVTLGHFGVAGALLNRLPGYLQANHEVQKQTDRELAKVYSASQKFSGSLLQTLSKNSSALAAPGGIQIPEAGLPEKSDAIYQMAASEKGPRNSVIPSPNGTSTESLRPLGGVNGSEADPGSQTPKSKFKKLLVNGLLAAADRFSKLDLNRFTNPERPPIRVNRSPIPDPVESLEQGIRLAIANGNQGKRQVPYTRWALDQTRDLPRTRSALLEVNQARGVFQEGIRERLSPLLSALKLPKFEALNEALLSYEKIAGKILGSKAPTVVADALLFVHQSQAMADPAFRTALTDTDLVRMGYEPMALEWVQKNGDKFLPGAVAAIFQGNKTLRDAPGAKEVMDSFKEWDPEKIKLSDGIRLGKPFKNFLKDPSISRLWLSELALHASVRKLIRQNPDGFLEGVLRELPLNLDKSQAHLWGPARRFLIASSRLTEEKEKKGLRGPVDFIARILGQKDFQGILRAQGAYESALKDLLSQHENELLPSIFVALKARLAKLEPQQVNSLERARSQVMTEFSDISEETRNLLTALEPKITDFVNIYDTEMESLRDQGMRVAMTHLEELFAMAQKKMGAKRYGEKVGPTFGKIREDFEAALAKYHERAPEARSGKLNPRDFNRSIEAALSKVMEGYRLLFKTARKNGITLPMKGKARRIIPLFETYAHKADLLETLSPWTRWKNVIQYGRPAPYRILRLNSAIHHGYPFQVVSRIFLDFGASVGIKAQEQTFYTDQNLESAFDYFNYAISGDHNAHLDFIGNADNIVQANLGDRARPDSIPDIIAKADLTIPVVETVFPYLTNLIPNDPSGIAKTMIRAAHMQAFGSLPWGRMRPTPPLAYDNLTMDVTNGEGPYVRDPHAPVTGSLPVMGRLFAESEAAAVITGRPQGILFIQDPGAIRNYPSQRGGLALLKNPSSFVSQFLPLRALPEPERGQKITLRNNVERLIWYLQAYHPSTNPSAPDTDAFYRGYEKPLDPESERVVANLFQGAWDLYPTRESLKSLESQRKSLEEQQSSPGKEHNAANAEEATQEISLLQKVLDGQTHQFLSTQLTLLDQKLERELTQHPNIPEAEGLRRLQGVLKKRLRLWEQVEAKMERGETLDLKERRFVEQAGATLAGREAISGKDPALEQLEFYFKNRYPEKGPAEGVQAHPNGHALQFTLNLLNKVIQEGEIPRKEEILSALQGKEKQLQAALARFNLGEKLTPVEEILISDLEGSLFPEAKSKTSDELVSALLTENISIEKIDQVLTREKIRQYTRQLIQALPGGGRGTVDPVAEHAEDISRVILNSAGQVVAGPHSYRSTAFYAERFVTLGAGLLGFIASPIDLLTGGVFHLYDRVSPWIARSAQSSIHWRPKVTTQGVRALEDIRIRAHEENRPIMVAANHASWTDIVTLMAVFPEGRFVYKTGLIWVLPITMALLAGKHFPMYRPKSRNKEETEKANRYVEAAGKKMRKHGVSAIWFLPGTRSLTGTIGRPKTGSARQANDLDAIYLVGAIDGTFQGMPPGLDPILKGMGTHRQVSVDFSVLDPRDLGKPSSIALTNRLQERIVEQYFNLVEDLRADADRGNLMAQAQLAELIKQIQPGMELVRQGKMEEATEWAVKMKTDPKFLEEFTRWWDTNPGRWVPPNFD